MIYLVQYDRREGKLIEMREFEDSQRNEAFSVKLEVEISLLSSEKVMEIVLLDAPSEEHLRVTHRRYFETLDELKSQKKKE